MDAERALISKIISTSQIEEAIAKGVRADLFVDEECRDMFLYLTDHVRKYRQTPSMAVVKDERPDFEWLHIAEPLEYVIDKFNTLVKRRVGNEYVLELARALDDPDRANNIDIEFLEASRKLSTLVPSTRVARFSEMENRIAEYEKMKAEGERVGVQFGFPALDSMTGGIQPHEFVTVSSYSGVGKSTMLQVICFNAYMAGKTPLFISLEMESHALLRRFDAMAAALDYRKMKQLDLSEKQISQWRSMAKAAQKRVHDIPIIDSIRHCTPDHVYAETVRHMPDLVIVDYLSLMRSSSPSKGAAMWQSVTEITQDLKQNARTLGIPVVAAAQTNRSGAKDGAELDNIGYSTSIVQDSDIVLGLYQSDEMKDAREMQVRVNKNRDGKTDTITAIWDHERMIFREKNLQDMFGKANRQ